MQLFKSQLLIILTLIAPVVALANEGHAGHSDGLDEHTIQTIIYQAINVGALIAGLIYFLKKPTQDFFANKKLVFLAAAKKAQSARETAEKEREQIQIKLNKLESTADESISRAKADAVDMKNQLLAEAMAASKRIREEAAAVAEQEVQRAINHLREEMIRESVKLSRAQLAAVPVEEQNRLQGSFIENMPGAR